MKRRFFFLTAASLLALSPLWVAPGVSAQARFPSRPITIVVPYAAGAAPDTLVRTLAPRLGERLGQPVVVENKPGAGGNIGAAYVAKAAPDGHTLLLATQPMVTINPHLYKNMGFDALTDLTPITEAVNVLLAMSVSNSVPANNLKEFVAYARKHPGVSYGTSGMGTPMHLAGLRLEREAGLQMVHVPYKGGSLILQDLAAGNIQMGMVDFASSRQLAEAGKIKLLGIGEKERFSLVANVPTLRESIPNFDLTSWFGFFGPRGLPNELTERWSTELTNALENREIKAKLLAMGLTPQPEGPKALARLVRMEYDAFGRSIRDNRISIDQ